MRLRVVGIPVPQGSKRHVGHGVMVEQGGERLKSWREAVRGHAIEGMAGAQPLDGPMHIRIQFLMPRPKNHYRSGKSSHILKPNAPYWHDKKPDVDKLVRGTLDALKSGGVYRDDSQVARVVGEKVYTEGAPGAVVLLGPLTGDSSLFTDPQNPLSVAL